MYVSYEVMIIVLIIFVAAIIKAHRMGVQEGIDESYDTGYEACKKDLNFDDKLKFEFEEFLYERGYVMDKSLTDIKTIKSVKKNNS